MTPRRLRVETLRNALVDPADGVARWRQVGGRARGRERLWQPVSAQSGAAVNTNFQMIPNIDTLDDVLARSHERPVALFNFDSGCGINLWAYDQLQQLDSDIEIRMVDVRRIHDVKRAIADRLGVRHESPQLILVRNGAAVWSASHSGISVEAVERAFADHAPASHP
jgi:bacillithiol system protein YtxJ